MEPNAQTVSTVTPFLGNARLDYKLLKMFLPNEDFITSTISIIL